MRRNHAHKVGRIVTYGLGALFIVLLFACGLSALGNQSLPTQSPYVDRLSSLEKARLAEYFHLHKVLGSEIWPGWGEVDIPVIVYNEGYAFLVGYADPPAGWLDMPQREPRGGPWEAVPDDKFDGLPYYRQHLTDADNTPEGFTVLVGDRWVASFQTNEYSEISFYAGLREEFPPLIREVVPYQVLWNLLSGESEAYITFLLHEAFHAYQGMVNPDLFAKAEQVMRLETSYPWDETDQRDAWQKELDYLVDAALADTNLESIELASQFLAQRETRRTQAGPSPGLVDFERQREWLEGLAKYAELTSGRMAATTPEYEPLPALNEDPEFNSYSNRDRFWSLQLKQVRRILKSEGEIRFYYSGFAQAVLLDRLMPEWKKSAILEGMLLEDLLEEAISKQKE